MTWTHAGNKILSDRRPQFASGMFCELIKKLGIQTALLTAHHPQTDGTTEHFNQEIEAYLSIYCTSHPEDWVDALPMIEFMHNNCQHSDWKNTPLKLMMGTNPLAVPLVHEYTKYPFVEVRIGPKGEGPFQITNILSPLIYSLQPPPTMLAYPQHISRVLTHPIHQKWCSQSKLHKTAHRINGTGGRRMGSWTNHWTLKTWTRLSISRAVEGISDHRSDMGTRSGVWTRTRNVATLQRTSWSQQENLNPKMPRQWQG